MSSSAWFTVLVCAVGVERVIELVVSRRHHGWAMSRGGIEYGFGHYPAMVVLHVLLLIGCLVEVWVADPAFIPWLGWPMLALVGAAQALRWWCIYSLGNQWNTRIVVVPGLPLVIRGPYKYLRHPNYLAVAVEGFALPLVHTAWITALSFSLANAAVLKVRISSENRALATTARGG